MQRLYSDDNGEITTKKGQELDDKIVKSIKEIIKDYSDYSLRDIEGICINAISGVIAEKLLFNQVRNRKENRKQ